MSFLVSTVGMSSCESIPASKCLSALEKKWENIWHFISTRRGRQRGAQTRSVFGSSAETFLSASGWVLADSSHFADGDAYEYIRHTSQIPPLNMMPRSPRWQHALWLECDSRTDQQCRENNDLPLPPILLCHLGHDCWRTNWMAVRESWPETSNISIGSRNHAGNTRKIM